MIEVRGNVLVIGGGPAGYVAAIWAGQLGLDVILVEGERAGGTCLNVGCIPSKALIHAAEEFYALSEGSGLSATSVTAATTQIDFAKTSVWKDGVVARLTGGVGALLEKAKVRVMIGFATLIDGKSARVIAQEGEHHIVCEHLVIATGSEPSPLAALPFGGDVLSSTDALALTELPKSLAVVGAGYIGLELGMAFAKLGVLVTIVEAQDRSYRSMMANSPSRSRVVSRNSVSPCGLRHARLASTTAFSALPVRKTMSRPSRPKKFSYR